MEISKCRGFEIPFTGKTILITFFGIFLAEMLMDFF